MITHNLGYPRIGRHRELKKANENYWAGKLTLKELQYAGRDIRLKNWQLQKEIGIDLIPSNDFSFYDHVLDHCLMVGAIPDRFHDILEKKQLNDVDLSFIMARGIQKDGYDITAMDMTKWFDTNYHYIVPEFSENQKFTLFSRKAIQEFREAEHHGILTKPVFLGPVSFLLLGKQKDSSFNRLNLIRNLLPVYLEVLRELDEGGKVQFIQFDEPCLSMNLTAEQLGVFVYTYQELKRAFPHLKIILASYFDCYGENLETIINLPIQVLHLDLARCPAQLDDVLNRNWNGKKINLSLGIVDGRNIWKNDFQHSLSLIQKATQVLGQERVWISPSCSLLHVPCDLDLEMEVEIGDTGILDWMAFAKQKLEEVVALGSLGSENPGVEALKLFKVQMQSLENRSRSQVVYNSQVRQRVEHLESMETQRKSPFPIRKSLQQQLLQLPLFPTTTIGSFPQTKEVREWRSRWKRKEITEEEYDIFIREEITRTMAIQENLGLDVLVHGEFERNDMVEYFGEQLEGYAFTRFGWVQSYGSRCVKPPVIVGDVYRKSPMTIAYTQFAQSLTQKKVKGMLTGPITMLQWSFVRDDQPRSATCYQIALAIRDEVADLEKAGIKIIQIDEPALREGLPLRKEEWETYLDWAVKAFKISSSGVADTTQIHTHMCYSDFNDIIASIAAMDADVITLETARSQMELLTVFSTFKYPNDIGPGVYDIHSPRIPSKNEMVLLIQKAQEVIGANQIWINPDCGLKTRNWPETISSLKTMVEAARTFRTQKD
ncbi:MAG: 5-methyltetrahydropteroyltriglutamate--homocysteine S-methyltransferase [Chitinophagaceae bacterium]